MVNALSEYIKRTSSIRVDGTFDQLLLGTIKPFKPVVKRTIAGWIKKVLDKSGINTTAFPAHSTRSASSSSACQNGASLTDILKRGNWSKASTWQRFYSKNIVEQGLDFQKAVYGTN